MGWHYNTCVHYYGDPQVIQKTDAVIKDRIPNSLNQNTEMTKETEKPDYFNFFQKLILDGLKARGYTEEEISNLVFLAKTTGQEISVVVRRLEEAKDAVSEHFAFPPSPEETDG